jgi:hypothetical protein
MAETADISEKSRKIHMAKPSAAQARYLRRGLSQAGGKLPLFDKNGQRIKEQTIRSCIKNGWCEGWARNPIMPDWLVCKLTNTGRKMVDPGV